MRTRPLAVALLLALAPASFVAPVAAQSSADDPTTAMARARFKEGVEFFDKGSFEQARASFLQAYALKKHPAVLLNLAWSCLKSGHALEAERYFRQYLSESKESSDKQRADANDGLNQAHTKLGRIEILAASGTDVAIDGEHQGTTPLADAIYVEPGAHTVRFKGPDGSSDMTSVTVLAGEKAIARFAKPVPTPPPAPTAGADTPPPPPATEEEQTPKPEEHTEAKPPPEPEPVRSHHPDIFSPPTNLLPVVLGGAVAVAGGVVALVMLHSKQQAQTQANNTEMHIKSGAPSALASHQLSCNPVSPANVSGLASACQAYISDNNDVNADATVGNIALGVGGAALAVTLIYYLAADKGDDSTAAASASTEHHGAFGLRDILKRAQLTPEIGRSQGGLTLTTSF